MNTHVAMALFTLAFLGGCGRADAPPADEESATEEQSATVSREGEDTVIPDEHEDHATDAGWNVDFSRYGPVPLGVGLAEADAGAPGAIEPLDASEGCTTTRIAGGRDQVWLMVVDGRVTRVDVYSPEVRTERGARIGDTEERIRELYPEGVEVQPHKYTDGHYLVVTPRDGGEYRMIFETDGRHVQNYRAGALPEVSWVEGCA